MSFFTSSSSRKAWEIEQHQDAVMSHRWIQRRGFAPAPKAPIVGSG